MLTNYNILDISQFPQAACALFYEVYTNLECGIQVHFQWCILNVSLYSVRSLLNDDFRHHLQETGFPILLV